MDSQPNLVTSGPERHALDGGHRVLRSLRRFWRETAAVTSVEYAMLLACILAVALSAVKTLGEKNYALWLMNSLRLEQVHFGE